MRGARRPRRSASACRAARPANDVASIRSATRTATTPSPPAAPQTPHVRPAAGESRGAGDPGHALVGPGLVEPVRPDGLAQPVPDDARRDDGATGTQRLAVPRPGHGLERGGRGGRGGPPDGGARRSQHWKYPGPSVARVPRVPDSCDHVTRVPAGFEHVTRVPAGFEHVTRVPAGSKGLECGEQRPEREQRRAERPNASNVMRGVGTRAKPTTAIRRVRRRGPRRPAWRAGDAGRSPVTPKPPWKARTPALSRRRTSLSAGPGTARAPRGPAGAASQPGPASRAAAPLPRWCPAPAGCP